MTVNEVYILNPCVFENIFEKEETNSKLFLKTKKNIMKKPIWLNKIYNLVRRKDLSFENSDRDFLIFTKFLENSNLGNFSDFLKLIER